MNVNIYRVLYANTNTNKTDATTTFWCCSLLPLPVSVCHTARALSEIDLKTCWNSNQIIGSLLRIFSSCRRTNRAEQNEHIHVKFRIFSDMRTLDMSSNFQHWWFSRNIFRCRMHDVYATCIYSMTKYHFQFPVDWTGFAYIIISFEPQNRHVYCI